MTDSDIFSRSISFENLPDDYTRNAVREFLASYDGTTTLCLQMICKFYPSKISLKALTWTDVLNIFAQNIRGFRKLIASFLIFCCEHKYIRDARIARLQDFASKSNTFSTAGIVEYILKDNDYETFKNSVLFTQINEPCSELVYTHCLIEEILPTDPAYLSLMAYLNDLKYNNPTVPFMKMQLINRFDEICAVLLGDPSEWTAQKALSILNAAKSCGNIKKQKIRNVLLGVLTQAYHDEIITDNGIKRLLQLNDEKATYICFESIIDILSSQQPEYWHPCTSVTPAGKFLSVLQYINHPAYEVRISIRNFLLKHYRDCSTTSIKKFCNEFYQSLGNCQIKSVNDFGYKTFLQQLRYFYISDGETKLLATSVLIAYYNYLSQEVNDKLFESDAVPTSILLRQNIAAELMEGFLVIQYNQLEDVPTADKWLFCYKKSNYDKLIYTKAIDFSNIESGVYRKWVKHYVWKADVLIETKLHPVPILAIAFNYLYALKTGKELSVFTSPGEEEKICIQDITAYKNHVFSEIENNRTRSSYIYNVRNVLQHVFANKLGNIESRAFYILTNSLDNNYDNTRPIPNNDLAALALLIQKKARTDTLSEIFSSIFYLALETEFRGSQIVDLNKNCLQPTAKTGEFAVVSKSKTSANELIEQPVSTYVEREIRHIITTTEIYRTKCTNTQLLDKLFIYPGQKKGTYRKISEAIFNQFLIGCCNELNLPSYTLANLRDTHMTKAEEFKIRNQLSDLEQLVLTGHKSTATDDIHYVKLDIREMLEAIHGVVIGDIPIEGKVLPSLEENIANASNEVEHGCGYCRSEACSMISNLDCVMCNNFVTTISRQSYFEEQINYLDSKIETAEIAHDKEDFLNIKRLMLRYIEEILKVKETVINEQ